MKAKSRKRSFMFVEVLQNGSLLANHAYPIGAKNTVRVTAKQSGMLSIPFYPLADDIDVFQTTKKGAKIVLNSTWDGFVSKQGEFLTISYDNCDSCSSDLVNGDFGCINLKDLKVLFRLGAKRTLAPPPLNKQYFGSISQIAFDNQENIKYFWASVGATLLLFSLALAALLLQHDATPNKLVDLKTEYLLPLIHPEHLKTLPEAMQSKLDRSIPMTCAINYYSSVISMLLDYPNSNPKMLFPSSLALYNKLHKSSHNAIDAFRSQQQERQREIVAKDNQGLIAIPAVIGESFTGSLLRLQDKITLIHQNLNKNLKLKRDYVDRVKKSLKREQEYNYEDYRNINVTGTSGMDILARVRVLDKDTNEEAMYSEFKTLGKEAAFVQNGIHENAAEKVPLSVATASPVGLGIADPNICYLPPNNTDDFNRKIGMIIAGEFAPSKPEKVKEALVGEINKDLIDRVIHANRFDLQLCYELALRRNQSLMGGMDVKWRLDSRGEISELEIDATTIHDRQMEKCLLKKIASWRFPRPNRGSVEINHHLSFSPAKG